MKIYVITSNKYTRSLCPPNIHFLNKYWPNQQISIVGYEDVNKLTDLPSNVETVCLGKQNEFGKMWTNALIPYFETVAEDYFVIMLDDHFLLGPVDFSKMNIVENWVKEGKILNCPWHGWEYDIKTGVCLSRRSVKLPSYPVRVEDGKIIVTL